MRIPRIEDVGAGVVVFLVALPLCLGIALASNAPIVSGLLSGIVGGILVGALSGSHTSVSGPAAGLTATVAAYVTLIDSFESFVLAVFIAGLLQIIFGLMRTGIFAEFFPNSVIKGMLAAIGVILILKQLPHLVGLDLDFEGDMAFFQPDNENTFSEIINMFSQFHVGALVVGLLSLVALLMHERLPASMRRIPGPLVVVAIGLFVSALLPVGFQIESGHRVLVPIIDDWSTLSHVLIFPNFAAITNPHVIMAGISIAVIGSLETLLNLDAIDKIDPQQRVSPPNRELIAQGIGNMVLGLIGGLPVTSVVIRSSVNINANGKTRWSTIFHGLLLFFSVLLLPTLLNQIPLATLAAILIVTGIKLASPKIIKQMWAEGYNQFLPFCATVVAIILSDLLTGVVIGMLVSLFFILKSSLSNQHSLMLEHHLGMTLRRIVFAHQVSFLNKASLRRVLADIPENSNLVLDARETSYIDADVLDTIQDFATTTAPTRNISVSLIGFKSIYEAIDSAEFIDHTTYDLQQNSTPPQILLAMKEGNRRACEGRRIKRDLKAQVEKTAAGQYPLAAILSCIDSRVPTEMVFDVGIGDVFSIRLAGNITSPKVLGSLEFAVVSGAKLIMVMGHTRCGAINASLDAYLKKSPPRHDCQHLGCILSDIVAVIKSMNITEDMVSRNRDAVLYNITKKNVLASIDTITRQSETIAASAASGKIAILGCIYDVNNGAVHFLDHEHQEIATRNSLATADA